MTTVPEELITRHINSLLKSDPGDALHHLNVVSAPRDAFGPLGIPAEEKLETMVMAIVADDTVDPVEFTVKCITAALANHINNSKVPLFAAVSQEVWTGKHGDEAARRAQREGRLYEYPNRQEATLVYAACRDGRRWRAMRHLTGPDVEPTTNVDVFLGRPDRLEAFNAPWGPVLRRLVGLRA